MTSLHVGLNNSALAPKFTLSSASNFALSRLRQFLRVLLSSQKLSVRYQASAFPPSYIQSCNKAMG
jgi:hypothetical protein